ncbi:MAG TPA: hypothetical protein VK695_15615 [Steroidobacteraceae bacterium]|jgi:hypothetical protein|nr:hypothetical protein [Steroidobacteraceae bacterium]
MFRSALIVSLLAAGFAACQSVPAADPEKAVNTAAAAPTSSAPTAPAPQSSALSYGTVTASVQRNKTTQLQILENFGGPNISTTDADGSEVWVYERSVTQTDIATQSKDYQGAVNLGVSFGFPHFGASGGGSAGVMKANGTSSTSAGTRTLTVIVKFNPDKTVKDYSVRATTF